MAIRLTETQLTELLNNSNINNKVKKQLKEATQTTTQEISVITPQEKKYVFVIEECPSFILMGVLLIGLIILILRFL